MGAIAKMDEMGKPAWIVAMILGFVFFWPIGLAILAFLIWSGRMGCRSEFWGYGGHGDRQAMKEEWRARKRAFREEMRARWHGHHHHGMRPSGNSAFDDYKAETIRRLEEEQEQFHEFLDQLRKSKDKAEFDDFMAQRRSRPQPPVDDAPEGPATGQ